MQRRGRPVLVWAPGEDGPSLRRTTPKNPVRWPAGGPACSRLIGPLGVVSAPRNSRGLPESRSRESRPATRGPLEPHCRDGGVFLPTVQRFAVRTRRSFWQELQPGFSRSSRVGPSGQLFTIGVHGVAVKATFRLARRICAAQDGRITSMEFPVMRRGSLLQCRCRRRNRWWTAQIPPGALELARSAAAAPARKTRPGRRRQTRRGGWAAAGGGPVQPAGAGGRARPGTIAGALARR
jgi:hypothetical protein